MLLRKEELRLYYVFYWIVPPLLRKFYGINKKKKNGEKINTLAPMKSEVVWAA